MAKERGLLNKGIDIEPLLKFKERVIKDSSQADRDPTMVGSWPGGEEAPVSPIFYTAHGHFVKAAVKNFNGGSTLPILRDVVLEPDDEDEWRFRFRIPSRLST